MFRQEYTVQLLDDLACQSYKPAEVIMVDATPESQETKMRTKIKYPFELKVIWQQSKGSCRGQEMKLSQQV
jgi:hypothetical protein